MKRRYLPSLRTTLRQTAAAYGYALTISSSSALLASVHGTPTVGDLFLFAIGGLAGFAILDLALELSQISGSERPEVAFPFAGTLNFFSVLAAIGITDAFAHLFGGALAWLFAPLLATVVYLTVVALQVAAVDALGRRRDPD